MQKIAFLSLIFVTFLGLAGYLSYSQPSQAQNTAQEDLCKADPLGNWQEFSNGCADSCEFVRNPQTTFCTQAFTYGCNCDPNSCWNGRSCEPISNTVPQFSIADFNQDGRVDNKDYEFMRDRFFKTNQDSLKADLSQDGKVNLIDYTILVKEWTR